MSSIIYRDYCVLVWVLLGAPKNEASRVNTRGIRSSLNILTRAVHSLPLDIPNEHRL